MVYAVVIIPTAISNELGEKDIPAVISTSYVVALKPKQISKIENSLNIYIPFPLPVGEGTTLLSQQYSLRNLFLHSA